MAMSSKRAGFTLVELMIAMIAGAFAVAGVYYLNGISARSYAQQMSVSDLQMSLRSAMEQIRRDVARAGYLAAPTTALLPNCTGALPAAGAGATDNAIQHFQALTVGPSRSVEYNPSNYASSGADVQTLIGANRVAFDDLTMFGNFTTSDAYLTAPLFTDRQTIVLQSTTESFRRSFFTPQANNGAATENYLLFRSTFSAGRMVRVEHGGRFYFRQIAAAGGAWAPGTQPSIPLTAALPTCVETTAWTAVAPVSRIHYGLESDLNPEFARLRANAALPGSRRMLLVRREENTGAVRPQDATALSVANAVPFATLPNTARIVLDYAVEFGISAVHNTQLTQTARPTWNYAITPAELAAVNVAPQNFRS
ncbi:MAG TPA: prepilin-type N-terminal cleavage/methylation domain-containing protein, partial [Polyangiales bacterium]|nr:prepilin-type N-terminal cleavage/methylation domain-containing protein [Polyangiales bacterium]